MSYWDKEFGDDLKRAGAQRARSEATAPITNNGWPWGMADPWDARFPHEVYFAPEPADRFCECMHILDEHVADLRSGSMRCDERNGAGKRICKCREFVCYEHPDNRCNDYDDEPDPGSAATKEK